MSEGAIRSIVRSIQVLQAINRFGSLTLSEIAQHADIPYPTAMRILRTLQDQGLIEREPARKRYRPTALVQTLSCGFQNYDRLVTTARQHIVELTRSLGWPISLATRVGQAMVVRDSTSSLTTLTFNNYYPGWRVPLLASASGRVYLAHAAEDERKILLDNLSPEEASQYMVDFDQIRKQGYAAVTRTAYSANPGMTSSIAVPLFEGETLHGALALVFFAKALTLTEAIDRFLSPLQRTAKIINDELVAKG
ncbi:MAG TPA: helix-turn-helix domain-containing protein [Sphingomonadales bacterium]